MYHRFVLVENNKVYPENMGLVNYASRIWVDDILPPDIDKKITPLIHWFNHYIQVPKNYPVHGNAWFIDRSDIIKACKKLTVFVEKHLNKKVAHLTTNEFSSVFYEDKCQIIAHVKRRKWNVLENL